MPVIGIFNGLEITDRYAESFWQKRSFYRTEDEKLVERLTNWQRKQWAKAGWPREPDALRRFARLQRDGTELWQGEILAPQVTD